MTYVIGDVHGMYDDLLILMSKIPSNSRVIFVGDLIDRGDNSSKVVEFVRKNNYECVLGNHESFMIQAGDILLTHGFEMMQLASKIWLNHGGNSTLISYSLAKLNQANKLSFIGKQQALEIFHDDIKWLKTLPLYLELDISIKGKKVVISHSSIANIWQERFDVEKLEEYALWQRDMPKENASIFNIFGHTPIKNIILGKNFVNVDTGCYYQKINKQGKLSAYCIEKNKIIHS